MMKKLHELETREAAGNVNPLNRRHFIDNKRVTAEEYNTLRRAPNSTLINEDSARNCGELIIYTVIQVS